MHQSGSSSVCLAAPGLGLLQNVVEYDSVSKFMDANWIATTAWLPAWLPAAYAGFYREILRVKISVIVTAIYLCLVLLGNSVNQKRKYRRWAWTESRVFQLLMLLHNAGISVFSICVLVKAVQVIYRGLPDFTDPKYGARMADYLCRIQAPLWTIRGQQRGLWSDFGGITETFCLSKYYELLDSAIIFATGRRLSNLHIFHHAGVIVCACLMWQLASPQAVIGIILNSTIHSLVYSYYLLRSLHIRVPLAVKKWLTALEIAQFILGWLMACSYIFVQYDAPALLTEGLARDWKNRTAKVPCLENHAHFLVPLLGGLVYLFPLTYLFTSFYATAYSK